MYFSEFDFFKEEEIQDSEIYFMPKLKIKEKKLLDKIFKKIFEGSFPCKISLGEFYNIYKIKDLEKVKNELLKFSKKKFYFNFTTVSKGVFSGEFSIISSFYVSNTQIIIFPPFEILASIDKNSIFHALNLSSYARFKEKHSFKFFPFLITNKGNSHFDFNVEDLKKILDVNNNYYERFYDFEKYVLKPLMADINGSTQFNLKYEKIKKGEGVTSKIETLRFYVTNSDEIIDNNDMNELLNLIKNKVTDLSNIHHLIENSIKIYTKETLESKVRWIEKTFKAPLDIFIIASLGSKYKEKNNSLKIMEISEIFSSHFKLEERVYKEMEKFKFIPDYDFLKELQNFRKTNNFNYVKNPWEIIINYKPLSISKIQISLNSEN